jgi:hypothetical protein
LYDKVKHLKSCLFHTDNWGAFAEVLPPERPIVGKAHTFTIEQDNSNTRHHWRRFTRRTQVVSKSPLMVSLSIRLGCALTQPKTFKFWQNQFIYISLGEYSSPDERLGTPPAQGALFYAKTVVSPHSAG